MRGAFLGIRPEVPTNTYGKLTSNLGLSRAVFPNPWWRYSVRGREGGGLLTPPPVPVGEKLKQSVIVYVYACVWSGKRIVWDDISNDGESGVGLGVRVGGGGGGTRVFYPRKIQHGKPISYLFNRFFRARTRRIFRQHRNQPLTQP